MKPSTVARAAQFVAVTWGDDVDIDVSNLFMRGPGGTEDNNVVIQFLNPHNRTPLHVFAADDGSVSVGSHREDAQKAMGGREDYGSGKFYPQVGADGILA